MAWQLAVLTGRHDGALATLAGASAVFGSMPECDIVLSDPSVRPSHAAVALDASGARIHALAAAPVRLHDDTAGGHDVVHDAHDGGHDRHAAAFTPWALGDVWVALVPHDFAWETSCRWPADPPAVPDAPARRSRSALALAVGLALGIGLVAALTRVLPGRSAPAVPDVATPAGIEHRIRALGLPDLQIAVLPDRLQIDGWVATQAQFEQLLSATGSDGAAARVNVRIGEDIARRAAQFIGPAVRVRYEGGRRILIEPAPQDEGEPTLSAAAIAQRIDRLRADLGAAVEVVSPLASAAQVAAPVSYPIPVQIVEVQADDPAHFRTRDGTRYFVGGRLPDGAEVVRIASDEIVFRHGERLIPYRLIN